MATVHPPAAQQPQELLPPNEAPELIIYSHSNLVYWWPVWAIGYAFALVTYFNGVSITVGDHNVIMHPSKNLGVLYTVIFTLVILITNVSLRGMLSVVVVITLLFFTVLFAWLDWWQYLMEVLPYLAIYMNLGFYVFFSTAIFIVWALAFFIFDRMTYWRIRPGQMTQERVVGSGERSSDTRGMVCEKHQIDFFKNVILGLGSGDLRIITAGARSEEILIPNVMFATRRVEAIQRLIAIKPTETHEPVVTAGTPG